MGAPHSLDPPSGHAALRVQKLLLEEFIARSRRSSPMWITMARNGDHHWASRT